MHVDTTHNEKTDHKHITSKIDLGHRLIIWKHLTFSFFEKTKLIA